MRFTFTITCALLAPAAWAAPTNAAAVPSPAVAAVPAACSTFVVQAANGTYKGQYLGPSDPTSLEITNVSEASRFTYSRRNGSISEVHDPTWLMFATDSEYGALGTLSYADIYELRAVIAKCYFEYWPATYKFARQNATQLNPDDRKRAAAAEEQEEQEENDEEEEEEEEDASFFVPYGPFKCHAKEGVKLFDVCPGSGNFVGFDKDLNSLPGCTQVELFAIPTCLIHE